MKIEKCPFCGKQIAEIGNCKNMEECEHFEECPAVEPYVCVVCSIHKGGCGASTGYHEGVEKAISAWNRRSQPETKPLTLDEIGQLRETQIPVWMGRAKEWIFVASVADAPYAQVWYFNAKGFAQTVLYHHEKFYRSKPGEVEHE